MPACRGHTFHTRRCFLLGWLVERPGIVPLMHAMPMATRARPMPKPKPARSVPRYPHRGRHPRTCPPAAQGASAICESHCLSPPRFAYPRRAGDQATRQPGAQATISALSAQFIPLAGWLEPPEPTPRSQPTNLTRVWTLASPVRPIGEPECLRLHIVAQLPSGIHPTVCQAGRFSS